jgi:hypothetical protein
VLRTGFWPSSQEVEAMIDTLDEAGDIDGALVVQQGIAAPLAKKYREQHGKSIWVAALAADPATEQGIEQLMAVDLRAQSFGRKAAEFLTGLIDDEGSGFEWRVNRDVMLLVHGHAPERLFPHD